MDHRGAIVDQLSSGQRKTGKTTVVALLPYSRRVLHGWIAASGKLPWHYLFTGIRKNKDQPITTNQYRRLVKGWAASAKLDPQQFSTHSLRRTKAAFVCLQDEDKSVVFTREATTGQLRSSLRRASPLLLCLSRPRHAAREPRLPTKVGGGEGGATWRLKFLSLQALDATSGDPARHTCLVHAPDEFDRQRSYRNISSLVTSSWIMLLVLNHPSGRRGGPSTHYKRRANRCRVVTLIRTYVSSNPRKPITVTSSRVPSILDQDEAIGHL